MTYPPPPGQPPYPPSPGEPLPPAVDPYHTPQYTQAIFDQPNQGQPGQGQPGYGQPGHTQPGYPPTAYPPTAYAQPGHPMAPPPRSSDSRAVAITLLSVAIALVVLVGGGVVFYLVGTKVSDNGTGTDRVAQGESAGPSPSPSPSPSATANAADNIRIKEPATLNGHDKIEAKELAGLTTELEKELEGYPGAANAFGAVYGDIADKKMIAVFAAEVDVDDPQRFLDTMFQSFSGESQLAGVSPASTGSLGGVAQCGTAVVGAEDVAICGWSDEGSVGMILHFYETAVDVKGDFPDMRAEIETKS
jgi:hypothetical protein